MYLVAWLGTVICYEIQMYDELKRGEGDNPTIGIVLCSDADEDIAKYSILHGNEQLSALKYKLYLPTEGELRAELEQCVRDFLSAYILNFL